MMEMRWEEFWWNHITGPHVVVEHVVTALLENRMVVLRVPSDLPWRHSMRSAIHTTFQERSDFRDIVIEPIDNRDDNPGQMEPGRFILERFANSTVRRGYREKSKASVQDYISAKQVIKNRIIWVKGLDRKAAEQWIAFCRGFSVRSAEKGLFVLEVQEDTAAVESGALRRIDFSKNVSSYDVQLFNSFALDEQKEYTEDWKRYIAACTASVCGVDAEISELMLRSVDFKTESAIEGIRRIAQMPEFARRGAEEASSHVLWNYRNGRMEELEHRIWSAQIHVLFPLIEMERVELIGRYRETIQAALDSEQILQYGVVLRDAIDAELGTLCYLMAKRGQDGLYRLYIPNETDRNRIHFLHDCRNALAHVTCCSSQQVCELLG